MLELREVPAEAAEVVAVAVVCPVARHHLQVREMLAEYKRDRHSLPVAAVVALRLLVQTPLPKQAAMAALARHRLSQAHLSPMQVAAVAAHIWAALRELAVPVEAAMAVSGLATTAAQTALPIQAVVAAVQEPTAPQKLEQHQPAATAALVS